jgi:aerobic carbon-monoxide dehydrogenase small subunit
MKPVQLTVNGRAVGESVEPRMHLADFLRERLNLTATHLRCEQGACGACTLLIDGQPARSCITYVGLCDGAEVTTVEGLEYDTVMVALRHAFSVEHGLQCGYCTPGMLITARDIVMRLPDADQDRIRLELSGNLCRCTGYVGIVRAISRVLDEQRRGGLKGIARREAPIGPVGARAARPQSDGAPAMATAAAETAPKVSGSARVLGLAGRQPNVEMRQSFTVSRPPEEVWRFLADTARVVRCVPGASLTGPVSGDHVEGAISVKLGPITANFAGEARIVRDDVNHRGTILGAGRDRLGGSRAAGELEYALEPTADGTRVALTIRALLTGPLAQFGRSGIVEDLVARLTSTFAQNLEARLLGAASDETQEAQAPLASGSLAWQVIAARVKRLFAKALGRSKP